MFDSPVVVAGSLRESVIKAYAPGTGTPEIGRLTTIQGIETIRGCWGLDLVGCDLVEVSPPYDTTGNTAITAANLLFEMLCVLPGVDRLGRGDSIWSETALGIAQVDATGTGAGLLLRATHQPAAHQMSSTPMIDT